ncbi:DNA-processing protein DprA [Brevibacterium ammoniilyticum]|uniref:DNA-processing protein DprA n=2 Tax=Brevibacterium ammoniilyticum TaxID=1046555 RepID=A0ABP9TY45_9MICO
METTESIDKGRDSASTTTGQRIAIAALLRIGEPGDGLLKSLVDAVGPIASLELIRAVARGEAAAAEAADRLAVEIGDLAGQGRLAEALARWAVRAADADGEHDLEGMVRLGGRLVIPADDEWPTGLNDLGPAAPLGLWMRGAAALGPSLSRAVAIVGARAASGYGTKCASDLAWDLAAEGCAIVSGGAFGIDAAAHRAALAREGTTLAFMAGGVDRFYPAANSDLFAHVLEHGALVSETAPGMTPMRHRFLLRNRLIAASALVTVVVEAGWRSGALNTARHALELSRAVAAYPGSVYSASSAGTNRLIRLHEAELVTGAGDVLDLIRDDELPLGDFGTGGVRNAGRLAGDDGGAEGANHPEGGDRVAETGRGNDRGDERVDDLGEREKICLNSLSVTKALDVGTISSRAGLTVGDALSALALLEIEGLSERDGAGWRKLRR